MRVLLLAPLIVACDPAEDVADEGFEATTDDATPPPPEGCAGPSAEVFFGVTPDDVIVPGELLLAESGTNGGAHVSMGLTVSAPSPNVAWNIDLIDVATGERVGGVVGASEYAYTALSYWTGETCTGYLPDARVCLGDCSNASLKCELDGRRLRAEAYTTVIGYDDAGAPQATVEFVLAGGC